MNKKFLSAVLFGALMVSSTGTFVSCKDYDEDIDRIDKELVDIKSALSALQAKVDAGKYVTNVVKNGDGITVTCHDKVTTKKRNAERYSDRIELQGFQSCFRLFVKPSQSPLKPNQDAATLLVRNHARNGDKRTRITKQGVKD